MKNLNVKIPEGCKSVSIRVEDGKIITEFIPKGKVASYEDALGVLGLKSPKWMDDAPSNVVAYHKLCTICDALNMGCDLEDRKFIPWWYTSHGAADGLGCEHSLVRFSDSAATVGSRLCSFDRETALYFGSEPFIKLWKEYLL